MMTLSLACALVSAGPAVADEAAWLYEPDHVTEIDLELPDESREALAADPDEYVEGTFSLERHDGTSYGPLVVGVKLKGNASFRTLDGKAAFKLKFNEFVKGQTFLGLKKLTLNNMLQDPTMLHEVLAYEAFRAAGLPGWRTGYAYVRVNGDDYGVYLNIETPDSVALKRWYPATQHLYEGEFAADVVDVHRYEIEEGDDDTADLEALIAAATDWRGMGDVADLEQMTRYWAVERYIGQSDGYTGVTPNNYYLHSDDHGVFTLLPWGTDQSFVRRIAYDAPGGLMLNRCFADGPACRKLYYAAVADVRATLGAVDLAGLAAKTEQVLEPWEQIDPRREYTLDEMSARRDELHAFLAARPGDNEWTTPPPPADEVHEETDPTTGPVLPAASTHIDPAPVEEPRAAAATPGAISIRAVRRTRTLLNADLDLPEPGRVTLVATATIGGKQRTVCRSAARLKGAGAAKARCRLTRTARRLLRSRQLPVAVSIRFIPSTGAAQSVWRNVRLR
jgi:hypothetical protein